MASSDKGVDWAQLGMALAVLIVLLAAVYLLPSMQGEREQPARAPEPITQEQFEIILGSAPEIAIVMDVRGATDNVTREAILQCGVNLARSMGALGKDVKSYSYDVGDLCYTYAGEVKEVHECEADFNGTYAFIVSYGPALTNFYRDRALISTNQYYGSACWIGVEEPPEEELPSISPNVTAETANMTPEEIFGRCGLREYCSTLAPEEQQTCLENAVYQVLGDPNCCFGIGNITARDTCIVRSAGVSHGVGEDYCQFVSSQELEDICYFNYATQWLHYLYCEGISNSSLRSECYVEMADAGVLPSQQQIVTND